MSNNKMTLSRSPVSKVDAIRWLIIAAGYHHDSVARFRFEALPRGIEGYAFPRPDNRGGPPLIRS